jgi:quaternary ammonium compound-resistance protein SugE
MAWIALLFAGLLEVGWAVGLKHTSGSARPWTIAVTGACLIGSLALLAWALRSLPLGTAYAVWTGIGAVGTAAVGMVFLGEAVTPVRLASIALIVAGLVGLKLAG